MSTTPTSGEHAEEPEITIAPDTTAAPQTAPPVVMMDASVQEWCDAYARSETDRERGGILFGQVTHVDGVPRVSVEAVVEAVGAEERRASITFTHQTWEHVNAVREAQYPQLRMVGWFHTHPGYGVFLSGFDLFIHRNFFNLPWQIAYVVDPLRGDAGFFVWQNGEITRLPSAEEKAPAAPAQPEPVLQVAVAKRSRIPVWAVAAVAIIVVLIIGTFTIPGLRKPYGHPPTIQPKPVVPPVPPPAPTVAEPLRIQYYDRVKINSGDTLWDIAHRKLGDPLRYPELQKINNITDPRRIPSGRVIQVPTTPTTKVPPKGDANDGQSQRDGD